LGLVGWVGDDTHVIFCQKIPGWKWKCETMRCRDATTSSFVVKVCGEIFARSRSKASQQCAELTAWPARTNYLWTIALMSKKVMSMLLTFFSTSLAFFCFGF
jgi:hypothetical protein